VETKNFVKIKGQTYQGTCKSTFRIFTSRLSGKS